jgi:diguanylate cyclase (GGDEF)-like protein/PAS domain S-box-containing protein
MRLLIVDDRPEDAEAIVSTLRNSGIAVRPSRPETNEDLAHILAMNPIDIALVSQSQWIPLPFVRQVIDANGRDIPLIAVLETIDDDAMINTMSNGARAVVLRNQPEHLLLVLQTERQDLETRRQLRLAEIMLRETERRCDALISSSRDPIAYIHDGMHVRANEAYLEIFGFDSFDDIEGLPLLDLIAVQDVEPFKQLLKSLTKGEPPPSQYKVRLRPFEGDGFVANLEFAPATYEGEACLQIVIRQQHEEFAPELAREVEELRQRDQVTGLLNRAAFNRILEDTVAGIGRGDNQHHGLLLVEADHYTQLLTSIGLDSADTLIASIAELLVSVVGRDLHTARYGEQTFVILIPGNYANTLAMAEKIRTSFSSHVFNIGSRSASITASIGGVQIGEKNASLNQVLNKAAESLRSTNEEGGNAIHIFDPGAVDRIEEERVQRWVVRIREALAGEGFLLQYQPVISLQGEPVEFYEAFLRMNVKGELVSPSTFLGIAEDHGLMDVIDMWVVKHAIAALGQQRRAGHQTRLLVKIGAGSFSNNKLVQLIQRELAAQDVPGESLWLEVPEAKVFTHLSAAQAFVTAIAPLGCKVGLEQFGSGLDSFQLLTHFRTAFLKIESDFIQELIKSTELQTKVRDLSERTHEDKIYTLAGNVLDAATMTQMFGLGIDYVSGEFVSLPGSEMNFDFN